MLSYKRTHTCGELNKSHIGKKVTLNGWINKRRDLGGLIFIDLRDRYGITQLLFDPETSKETHSKAYAVRNEWVISISGTVKKRSENAKNLNMKTGDIEIEVNNIGILSKSKPTPFPIFDDKTITNEEIRLKYRYLDIRREEILNKLKLRHTAMLEVRNFLNKNNFLEINTPILCKSTPEGARDYLVPSRLYPGNFYALPQSPQIFKQLLMIGGIDKYFQIATCFRDEDPRADRQPEFTQIDIEMSFAHMEDIFHLSENLIKDLFKSCLNKEIKLPFTKMTYKDCLDKYGTDKPDLRFDMQLVNVNEIAEKSSFSIFLDQIKSGGIIKGICIKNGAELSRKKIDEYTSFVQKFGLKGLAFMKLTEEGLKSNIAKFFDVSLQKELIKKMKMKEQDLVFIAAEKKDLVNQALDHLRRKIAKDRNLIKDNDYKLLWVTDFPLFEKNKEGEITSLHHPFTNPHPEDIDLLDKDPLKVRAEAYDLVLNGYEIAGGSRRIHDSEVQKKIFKALKLTENDIQLKFGFFTEALNYGTPPHLGIAFGFDRIMMLLTNTDNIRDVIAFPKTLKGLDLMMQAPSFVNKKQLEEVNVKTIQEEQISGY